MSQNDIPAVTIGLNYTAKLLPKRRVDGSPFPLTGTIEVQFWQQTDPVSGPPTLSATLANGRLSAVDATESSITFNLSQIAVTGTAAFSRGIGTLVVLRQGVPTTQLLSIPVRYANQNEALAQDNDGTVVVHAREYIVTVNNLSSSGGGGDLSQYLTKAAGARSYATRAIASAADVSDMATGETVFVRGHTTEGVGGAFYVKLASIPGVLKPWHLVSGVSCLEIKAPILNPTMIGMDLTQNVTDQSAIYNLFWEWLYAKKAESTGLVWGTFRAQNIAVRSGIRCHSEGSHQLIPDTVTVLHPMTPVTACMGIYNSEQWVGNAFSGEWSFEGLPGAVAANGVGGMYIYDAVLCHFGTMNFKNMPAGIQGSKFLDCVIDNMYGEGMRGWQVATRSGTGGTLLGIAGFDRVTVGNVVGKDVWKPLVYFSHGTGLPPNKNVTINSIICDAAIASGESHALAFRSFDGVKVGSVFAKGGPLGVWFGIYTGDTAGGVIARNAEIGFLSCDGQNSTGTTPAPSLIAALETFRDGSEPIIAGIKIGTMVMKNQTSYGIFGGAGDIEINTLFAGDNSASIRESVRVSAECRLTINRAVFSSQKNPCIKFTDGAFIRIKTLECGPMAAATQSVLLRDVAGTATAKIDIDAIRLTGIPAGAGTSWPVNYVYFAENLPLRNFRLGEFDVGSHSLAGGVGRLKGITLATGCRRGLQLMTNDPTGTDFVLGDSIFNTTAAAQRNWNGTAWAVQEFSGSTTYDAPSLADGAGVTSTVTVTGAVLGDSAEVTFSIDLQGLTLTSWVSAANTVSFRLLNQTGGVIDLASATVRAFVTKRT